MIASAHSDVNVQEMINDVDEDQSGAIEFPGTLVVDQDSPQTSKLTPHYGM